MKQVHIPQQGQVEISYKNPRLIPKFFPKNGFSRELSGKILYPNLKKFSLNAHRTGRPEINLKQQREKND
ncbi:hypothetical protein LEP1GSC108_2538 [Leptospira weilii str. UI 13098]|uniref:Uncharacterized protein n=1 Tax=Leptospira weilii str. UI 13098 TaxID=1088542 RepID=M6Q9H2_9LEPT|nr:hypothetical protein LEP1GSC108_2538 [Leptospira weilii str. UI 13098]